MFKNYLKNACNNMFRHGSHTVITILGLVLGMTSCILIMLYVLDELAFDRWLPEAEAVYRLETVSTNPNGAEGLSRKSALRAKRDLLEFFPEIAAATRIIDQSVTMSGGEQDYLETAWFVDPEFLDVFQLPLLAGNSATALTDKTSMLISAAMAEKYFADGSALGQTLALDDTREYRVAGVFENVPQNSHVNFDVIVPYDENDTVFNFGYSESWGAVEGYTYFKLAEGTSPEVIDARLPAFVQQYFQQIPATGQQQPALPRLRPLNVLDIHLDGGGIGNIKPPGNRQVLVTLALIALLVLTIAAINFVNLATVQLWGRAREVSVRKAIGAQRKQLLAQFLCESVLVSVIALAISASLVELLLPAYNTMLGREIDIDYLSLVPVVLFFLAIGLGIASGFFPAWRLSAWQPATLLHSGSGGTAPRPGWLQAILVTLQFAISATLVITTLVVLLQQIFIEDKDLGYTTAHKLVIRNLDQAASANSRQVFAAEVAELQGVLGTAFSTATPGDLNGAGFYRNVNLAGYPDEIIPLYPKAIDADFFDVYDIPVIGGRGFSAELRRDQFFWPPGSAANNTQMRSAAIVNTAAMRTAGFASVDDALGSIIQMQGTDLEIIGVVPDVNFQSLRSAVTPNMYLYSPEENFPALTVAYAEGVNEQVLLAQITEVWDGLVPAFPLAFEFVEDNVRAQYAQDRLQFLLITIFSSLAISIACLGLYALASYSTRQRTREIGIRKIHGALSTDILQILLLQFSKPVVMANFLAWPVAWYAMDRYLGGFVYRIDPGPSLFILASLATIMIAWSAIILHVAKVVNSNPVNALRYRS